MEIARIEVGRTTGTCTRRERIPAGIAGASVQVSFTDPVWDKLIKTVVFRGKETKIAEFDGAVAEIPHEVIPEPRIALYFGIFGQDPDTDLQIPLIEVYLGTTEKSTDANADPAADPTLPIWAQLQQDIEEIKQQGPGSGGNVENGEDGFSIIAKVEQTDGGAVISITDKDGTTTATITNGKDGSPGDDGSDGITPHIGSNGNWFIGNTDTGKPSRGADGQPGQSGSPGSNGSDGVSATHSWNGTVLTVTSASGTSSADLKGATGSPGKDGSNGQPGADGVSPTVAVSKSGKVTTVSITDKNGTKTATINDGVDGSPGSAGKDGTSVTVKSVTESTADGGSNVITFSDGKTVTIKNGSKGSTGATGATGSAGKNGEDGYTPVRGTDYWTEADKVEIVQRVIEALGGNPIFGIVDENNNIIVSGNLPDGAYSVKYEMEDGSKVNIGDLVLDSNVYYTVTNTLTNCVSSNSDTQAIGGKSYSATISANDGYELSSVMVTMGGTDISSTAVSGGTITIASVTGNIVITAVAEEAQMRTNFAEPNSADWLVDSRVRSNGNIATPVGGDGAQTTFASNYIAVQNGDIILIKNASISLYNQGFYDANKTKLQAPTFDGAQTNSYVLDVTDTGTAVQFQINVVNTEFMRFSLTQVADKNAVVINIKRNGEWL